MSARSYLFVPADRPERIAKALASGADAVIVDLEDAVALEAKIPARASLANWLNSAQASVLVRVNGADTPWYADDIALCRHAGVAAVVIPKAEREDVLARAFATLGKPTIALIESAAGFANARGVAGAPGVARLAFGSIDFQLDCGIEGDDDALLTFRSELVLVSRLAEREAPIDGVSAGIDDAERLQADAQRAKRLGFGGKLCIHPLQVRVVNHCFEPSDEERIWAMRVLEAAARSGGGAVAVDGRMVDRPLILRARRMLGEPDEPR